MLEIILKTSELQHKYSHLTISNFFMHEVHLNLNVFSVFMLNWIVGCVHCASVITIHKSSFCNITM